MIVCGGRERKNDDIGCVWNSISLCRPSFDAVFREAHTSECLCCVGSYLSFYVSFPLLVWFYFYLLPEAM